MAEVTDAEIINIAHSFLLNSPPGEFLEVVTDVRALLPNESLLNKTAASTFRQYNTEQLVIVESPNNSHKVLISKYGEVGEGEYVDPKGQQVIQYDHIRQTVTGSRALNGELDAGSEPLRAAIEKAMFEYADQHYPAGATTVYSKDGSIIIAVSSARFNSNNFWNGRWRSVWTLKGGNLNGHYRIVVHYYEDGNVQLNADHKVSRTVNSGDPAATAKAVVAQIKKDDAAYHSAIDTSYNTMGDTTYKALRRALPITRQKVDWHKIQNYQITNDMTGKKK